MKKMKKRILSILCSASLLMMAISPYSAAAANKVTITINPSQSRQTISPYIYGVNDVSNAESSGATALRLGGNRLTAYNWENNFSNAGADWFHNSDTYLVRDLSSKDAAIPGIIALNLSKDAMEKNIDFTIMTLQMAGYAANDAGGPILDSERAYSVRWARVFNRKNAELSLTPDTTDGAVYMDEFLNYLVSFLGGAGASTGIKAYSLDNEPGLWKSTHSMLSTGINCKELVNRSADLASVVKDVDPEALVFGPALYGMTAYQSLCDASDWNTVKGNYRWFIDYYLSGMKTASEKYGSRLLDVLDVHYYSSDAGDCGEFVTNCSDTTHTECIQARMQAPRSLYDKTYIENSWIGQWCKDYLPLLKNLNASINTYYSGTKLALTEYNFGGGNHISGAIAEADALGAFAAEGVFCANVWEMSGGMDYINSAMKLYTNYDSNGSSFGDTLVSSSTDNIDISTCYASIDGVDESVIKLVVTNKSMDSKTQFTINLDSTGQSYKSCDVYMITSRSSDIVKSNSVNNIKSNSFTYELEPMCVAEFIIYGESTNDDSSEDTDAEETTSSATESSISDSIDSSENTSDNSSEIVTEGSQVSDESTPASDIIVTLPEIEDKTQITDDPSSDAVEASTEPNGLNKGLAVVIICVVALTVISCVIILIKKLAKK